MAGNQIGKIFTLTSFGESHGPALGGIIDGVPPSIDFDQAMVQEWLDRRRPGQSKFTTQRQEADQVMFLSGLFEGKTTGQPIGFQIANQDQRSKDYSDIATKFRPGHADFSWWRKYGIRDYRGGGRSSARETACRVVGGAVAMQVLAHILPQKPTIRAAMVQMGARQVDRANWSWDEVHNNPFFCPDAETAQKWEQDLAEIRKAGSSIGAVIEVQCDNIPAGLGEPVFDRLDADLAKALMSINAVKAVEIGEGMAAACLRGEENADQLLPPKDKKGHSPLQPEFTSNHAGGVLGGVSTGQTIIARFAVKPTSSILIERQTLDETGAPANIVTKGRHDPCVGIRAVPIGEAMAAIVLADHLLRHRAQCGL